MDPSKPKSTKQLKEHLQNHQEPFSLQNYLIERSYMFSNCNNIYSAKNLKWSIKYDHLHKIRKKFLLATAFLRSLLYKFIQTVDDNKDFSSWDEEQNSNRYHVKLNDEHIIPHTLPNQQTNEVFEIKRFFAVSDHFTNNCVEENHSSTLVDMFDTFTLPKLRTPEVYADTKPYYWISSTYVRKLLVNSNILKFRSSKKEKQHEQVKTASLCQRNRKVLLNRNQLPFECEDKILPIKAVSESEEFQCVVHGHFSFLEKQYTEVKKIMNQLLHTESSVILSEECKSFQIVNWKIHLEIGDSIMDDIVMETIDLFCEA